MAPKQPTKVAKSPVKPRDTKESSDLKRQLLFLWTCHKVSNGHIDFPAVAKHFGIKTNAATMRFKRLKKKLDAMETSVKSDDQDQDKDDDQEKTQTGNAKTEDEDDSMDEIPPDSE